MLIYFHIHSFIVCLYKALKSYFFHWWPKRKNKMVHLTFFRAFFCLLPFFVKGESLVPEQANEVEESKRRTARSCCSRKGTGECEKRNTSPFRAFGNRCSHSPTNRGLSSEWRQPRQWPQLRACTLMIYTEGISSILRKEMLWWQAFFEHRLHREMTRTVIFNIIKFRHLESVSHDI